MEKYGSLPRSSGREYDLMNRMLTKGFLLLAVLSVVLAGSAAAMLLLVPGGERGENFGVSLWVILIVLAADLVYMVFHLLAGRNGRIPLSLLRETAATSALYTAFVLVNTAVSDFWLGLSKTAYITTHVLGFLILAVGGGVLSVLSLSSGEDDTDTSLRRSRLFVLTTRIASLAEEMSLCAYRDMVSGTIEGLKDLEEAIRFSDPESIGGSESEDRIANAVDDLEEKGRRFLALGSGEERKKTAEEMGQILEMAFSAMKAESGRIFKADTEEE